MSDGAHIPHNGETNKAVCVQHTKKGEGETSPEEEIIPLATEEHYLPLRSLDPDAVSQVLRCHAHLGEGHILL